MEDSEGDVHVSTSQKPESQPRGLAPRRRSRISVLRGAAARPRLQSRLLPRPVAAGKGLAGILVAAIHVGSELMVLMVVWTIVPATVGRSIRGSSRAAVTAAIGVVIVVVVVVVVGGVVVAALAVIVAVVVVVCGQ